MALGLESSAVPTYYKLFLIHTDTVPNVNEMDDSYILHCILLLDMTTTEDLGTGWSSLQLTTRDKYDHIHAHCT